MLKNADFLAKIGADTAENEQHFAEILPKNWHRRDPADSARPAAGSPWGPRPSPRQQGEGHVPCRRNRAKLCESKNLTDNFVKVGKLRLTFNDDLANIFPDKRQQLQNICSQWRSLWEYARCCALAKTKAFGSPRRTSATVPRGDDRRPPGEEANQQTKIASRI